MKSLANRVLVSAVIAVLGALALAAAAPKAADREPGKLIILSTGDVKGKTSPCG